MDQFITRPLKERLEIISQTAAKLDMAPAAIEKDFWVCWMLQRLFQSTLKEWTPFTSMAHTLFVQPFFYFGLMS